MSEPDEDRPPVRTTREFGLGAGVGLLLGLLASLMPVLSIAAVVVVLVLALLGLIRRDSRPRTPFTAGALVVSGALYVYGAVVTTAACLDGRCGDADPLPLVLFAGVVFGFGMVATVRLIRDQDSGDAPR